VEKSFLGTRERRLSLTVLGLFDLGRRIWVNSGAIQVACIESILILDQLNKQKYSFHRHTELWASPRIWTSQIPRKQFVPEESELNIAVGQCRYGGLIGPIASPSHDLI